uniref:Uncharacterized protein n=1 Tax=viral metagenome TaxID=1070528 RepID=A0A6C0C0N3_9ZZZZ
MEAHIQKLSQEADISHDSSIMMSDAEFLHKQGEYQSVMMQLLLNVRHLHTAMDASKLTKEDILQVTNGYANSTRILAELIKGLKTALFRLKGNLDQVLTQVTGHSSSLQDERNKHTREVDEAQAQLAHAKELLANILSTLEIDKTQSDQQIGHRLQQIRHNVASTQQHLNQTTEQLHAQRNEAQRAIAASLGQTAELQVQIANQNSNSAVGNYALNELERKVGELKDANAELTTANKTCNDKLNDDRMKFYKEAVFPAVGIFGTALIGAHQHGRSTGRRGARYKPSRSDSF